MFSIFAPFGRALSWGPVGFISGLYSVGLGDPDGAVRIHKLLLTINPKSLRFGSVQLGERVILTATLTNTGGSPVTVSQANLSGSSFSLSGITAPFTLNANQSLTFSATFAPTAAGPASGSLEIVSNASNSPLNVPLSGTGAAQGQLAVSPATLSFGNVVVGTSASLNGKLSASGASLTIFSATIDSNEFALSGLALPLTLPKGQSTSFSVVFTPQATGAASASLTFASNGLNSPTVQTMTGSGTAATQHVVDLTWNASPGAIGYNIYRSQVSGGPYSIINSALDSSAAYTDSDVSSGETYYYVATAVDSNQAESGYSNQAVAQVPTT
jgi:hypothetical protein